MPEINLSTVAYGAIWGYGVDPPTVLNSHTSQVPRRPWLRLHAAAQSGPPAGGPLVGGGALVSLHPLAWSMTVAQTGPGRPRARPSGPDARPLYVRAQPDIAGLTGTPRDYDSL